MLIMSPDNANQNIEIPQNFRFPISDHIEIPAGLELISQPHQSEHGTVFVDKERKLVYRKMELGRGKGGNEDNGLEDFWRKIEVSMTDKTGLTPKIYRYDPKNFILEMEYVDGTGLDNLIKSQLSIEAVRNFIHELGDSRNKDLFLNQINFSKNLILDNSGRLRVSDPIATLSASTHSSLLEVQNNEVVSIKEYFKQNFGLTEENLIGKIIESTDEIIGKFKFKLDTEIDPSQISFVYQRGIGFAGGVTSKRYLETSDFSGEHPMFNSCVAIVVRDPVSKLTALIHADTMTDMVAVKQKIEDNMNADTLEISVIGGETDYSEDIIKKINEELSLIRGVVLTHQITLGERGRVGKQVVVDTETGDITILMAETTRNFKPPEELEKIVLTGRRNILSQSEKGLVVDV